MASSQPLSLGFLNPWSTEGEYNTHLFAIQAAIQKIQTATLVQIVSCTNAGGVSPFGFVNVTPMVALVDGSGNLTPEGTVFQLPYLRIQGGAMGIICDPAPGDIGIAVFASRDISSVKATQAPAGPGSGREYDFADGMYLGGVLNPAPTTYIQFGPDGITILSPSGNIILRGGSIQAGSSPAPVVTEAFITEWINALLRPALATAGIVVAAPAPNALTTTFEAS